VRDVCCLVGDVGGQGRDELLQLVESGRVAHGGTARCREAEVGVGVDAKSAGVGGVASRRLNPQQSSGRGGAAGEPAATQRARGVGRVGVQGRQMRRRRGSQGL
jgi:hypothetical protein